jgi:hypothetical protein
VDALRIMLGGLVCLMIGTSVKSLVNKQETFGSVMFWKVGLEIPEYDRRDLSR